MNINKLKENFSHLYIAQENNRIDVYKKINQKRMVYVNTYYDMPTEKELASLPNVNPYQAFVYIIPANT